MHAPQPAPTYVARQLQSWDENGWAVISLPAGAIVVRDEKMLMKLTKADAERLVEELNRARSAGRTP